MPNPTVISVIGRYGILNDRIYFFIILWVLLLSCSKLEKGVDRTSTSESRKETFDDSIAGPTVASSRFKDVTEELGLSGIKATYSAAVDLNNDSYTDLVFLNGLYDSPDFYFYNAFLKKFVPMDYEPFQEPIEASFLLFYDFDKDGVKDLVSAAFNYQNHLSRKPIKLFKGYLRKGRIYFIEKKSILIKADATSSILPVDINKDGYLDLYIANWYLDGELREDKVLMGLGLNFTDKTDKYIKNQPPRPTLSLSSCDVNNDHIPDILTTSSKGYSNYLYLNLVDHFNNIGKQSYYGNDTQGMLKDKGGGRTQFANCFDLNQDGRFDVFLGELNYSFDGPDWDRSSILVNSNQKTLKFFRREILVSLSEEQTSENFSRGTWQDFNLDGEFDLLVDNTGFPPHTRLSVLSYDGVGFKNISQDLGLDILNPSNSIVLDFNNDGKLDILTTQMNIRNVKIPSRVYLFENKIETDRDLYKIYFKTKKSNKEAVGSRVEVWSKKKRLNIWYELTQGFLSPQHAPGVFFSLAKGKKVEKIIVYWSKSTKPTIYKNFKIEKNKGYYLIELEE